MSAGNSRPRRTAIPEEKRVAFPEIFAILRQLTGLNLLGSAVTDKGLQALNSLPKLESLAISPLITDDGLAVLKEFPRLEAVTVPCPKITDKGMEHLAAMKQLTNLGLHDTQVSDEGAVRLAGLKNLILLDLRGTKITEKGMDVLRNSLTRIQHLAGP